MIEKSAKQIEVEEKIAALLYQIRDIVKAYAPDDDYLSLLLLDGNYISFNNQYYRRDPNTDTQAINFSKFDEGVEND